MAEWTRVFVDVNNDGIWCNYERLLVQNLVSQFYLHVLFGICHFLYHQMALTLALYSGTFNDKHQKVLQIRPRPLPSALFLIHYLLTTLLNNHKKIKCTYKWTADIQKLLPSALLAESPKKHLPNTTEHHDTWICWADTLERTVKLLLHM